MIYEIQDQLDISYVLFEHATLLAIQRTGYFECLGWFACRGGQPPPDRVEFWQCTSRGRINRSYPRSREDSRIRLSECSGAAEECHAGSQELGTRAIKLFNL